MEDEILRERYSLLKERLSLQGENEIVPGFLSYYEIARKKLESIYGFYELFHSDKWETLTYTDRQQLYESLYDDMLLTRYENSYLNPAFAVKELGEDCGGMFSMLYADLFALISAAVEDKLEVLCIFGELFVQIGCSEESSVAQIKENIYWFYHDYAEMFIETSIQEMLYPNDFMENLVMESDLKDLRYLYQYGVYITDNEWKTADFLNQLSEEQIEAMARTYTEGYRIGFEATRKDISKKKYVKMEYPIGFERVVRAAVKQFAEIPMYPVFSRENMFSFEGRGIRKRGCYSTSFNKQFDFDHKDDRGYYFDKHYVNRRLEIMKEAFENNKEQAQLFGGPAVIESFGEPQFMPASKPEAYTYDDKQNELQVTLSMKAGALINEYIPGEEYSFTMISYPLPCIGDHFQEIFTRTMELNTLDYIQYRDVQKKLIDVLDLGKEVHILGKGDNQTRLIVSLHPLTDPLKETNFENCVADVNIPVGEVFTSPVLQNTSGTLHVSQVFLGSYGFCDLKIEIENGMITDYSCTNFDDPMQGKKLIFDQILFHHSTLPMGEFAIGTNTTAYKMGKDYQIFDRLPILIAEKTGPHFAFGDTCYSHAEDVPMYNFDGKEVIARDNECSMKRKSNPEQAYFNCHTDITIPFEELAAIYVVQADGKQYDIIKDGHFVVEGTEFLNIPLDA